MTAARVGSSGGSMLLAIDVGNTNVVFGLAPTDDGPLVAVWRLASRRERTADEWYALLASLVRQAVPEPVGITDVVISSVVPPLTTSIRGLARTFLGVEPLVVSAALDLGIRVATDAPLEVGTDRIMNCVAAFARFGGPTIVIDLGTATKIEAITADGAFLGGAIAPGLGVTLDALASRAARLYAVELQLPPRAVGRSTVAAVQSGVVGGHLAMIEGMVGRIERELGKARHVVLTGGYAPVFADTASVVTDVVPDLILHGLRLVYRRNARDPSS